MIIDVSKHNGRVDWLIASKWLDFALIKASEGATLVDNQFLNNVKGAAANGVKWGAYHFATWNKPKNPVKDGRQEAQFFMATVAKANLYPDMPCVLDIESNSPIPYTRQMMNDYVSAFIEEVKKTSIEPAIYGSPGFLNSYLPTNHTFGCIKLWVADYTDPINKAIGWDKPWLHQFTDKGSCPGVKGNVDLNRLV